MTIPRPAPSPTASVGAIVLMLVLMATGIAAHAAGADPLQSDACRGAIASLQVEEAAEAARHAGDGASQRTTLPSPGAALQAARRNAAKRCLAGRADVEPPSGRFAQAPIVVEPVGAIGAHAGPRGLVPAPAHATPSPQPRRPDAVVSCDSGGCWANDGSRLQRNGPVLWGPRGACTVQGASLQCP